MILMLLLALLGLWIGGFGGLLIGLALGYLLRRAMPRLVKRGLGLAQAQYLNSTFAVMGALCKADGQVSRNEIQAVEALFARMHLGTEQREQAKAAFTRGKAPDFDLDAEVAAVARACRGQMLLMRMFLQVQLVAVAADGAIHPAEHRMLLRVARGLGLAESEVEQLESTLRAAAGGAAGATASPSRLDDAYRALGVTRSAADAEVKRAYRRLVSENHPDKLASRGLPESMRELAEQRTREITVAYGLIKEARGMN
jgi:DnaJ like chaperone protein